MIEWVFIYQLISQHSTGPVPSTLIGNREFLANRDGKRLRSVDFKMKQIEKRRFLFETSRPVIHDFIPTHVEIILLNIKYIN